ncbi:MAG: hypothetical protein NW205_07565 [Hyphomicrobiaceae bacterium]|nr:hypothetical protein [Hyphomicrobiaceae bacterium]
MADCQATDEATFRAAIEKVTIRALEADLSGVDYEAIVASEWRKGGLSDIIDARVDIAVEEVRKSTGWGTLLQSLASQEQAQKLTTDVAERVYRSDAVTSAIERLAIGVSTVVGSSIEQASLTAAEPALRCLNAYLGPRYGEAIAQIVGGEAGKEFTFEAGKGGEISSGTVISEASGGLAGAAILLVRRQLANLARNVGARIVGSVLSRLVSVVAGGIGLVLIAKDIWDLRNGILPIIASEMKSDATKEKVREELAHAIAEQIRIHVRDIGKQSADRVVSVWREFQSAHLKALEIAERNAPFRRFINSIGPDKLGRLDEVVSLVLPAEGEAGLIARLENGSLAQAVRELPEPGMAIARATRSIEAGLKWTALAGARAADVVAYGVHLETTPETFTPATLVRILDLADQAVITRLATQTREARETLLELDDGALKSLAKSLTAAEIGQLARYLTGLEAKSRDMVLRAVAANPARMQVLASDRVRSAVLASADQQAAVEMMLRVNAPFDPVQTYRDMELVWSGDVSPTLIVDKHPFTLAALVALIGILVLVMLRLVARPARREQTAETDA